MATIEEQIRFWTLDPGTIRLAQICDTLSAQIQSCCGGATNSAPAAASPAGSADPSAEKSAAPASGSPVAPMASTAATGAQSETGTNKQTGGRGKRG